LQNGGRRRLRCSPPSVQARRSPAVWREPGACTPGPAGCCDGCHELGLYRWIRNDPGLHCALPPGPYPATQGIDALTGCYMLHGRTGRGDMRQSVGTTYVARVLPLRPAFPRPNSPPRNAGHPDRGASRTPAGIGVRDQVSVSAHGCDALTGAEHLPEKLLDLPSESDPKGKSRNHHARYRPDHRRKEVIMSSSPPRSEASSKHRSWATGVIQFTPEQRFIAWFWSGGELAKSR
jgi:hypothetical protein